MDEGRTKEDIYQEAKEWKDKVRYNDEEGKPRPLLQDEDGRLYFPALPLDFDKDDIHRKKYYLDEMEGWKQEYQDVL